MTYYSSTELDDIVPSVTGVDAVAEFCPKDKAKRKAQINKILQQCKMLESLSGETIAEDILAQAAEKARDALEEMMDDCEAQIHNTRMWALMSYQKMREHVPVMTGHLRESIRFMGTGVTDIDVAIDPDVISEEDKLPNLVPYYNGAAPFTRHLMVGGVDYSDFANSNARPKEWWKGGTTPLKGFKDPYWEINIKQMLAEKYGVSYTPEMY